LSHKNRERIKQLLRETNFVKCVYQGGIRLMNRKKILFYDVDFYDSDGNSSVVREFIPSEFKDKLLEITDLLARRVKIGTEIKVETE
jgi:hypothetical protein